MDEAATSARRSFRKRKSTALYDDQVAWDEAIQLIRAGSNSPDRSSTSSDEQVQGQVSARAANDDGDIEMQQVSDEDEALNTDANDGSEIATPDEAEFDSPRGPSTATSKPGDSRIPQKSKTWARPKSKCEDEQGSRNRMYVEDIRSFKGSTRAFTETYGPDLVDLYPVLKSRDVWRVEARDAVLPSRKSMKMVIDQTAKDQYLIPHPDRIEGRGATLSFDATGEKYKASPLSENDFVARKFTSCPIRNALVTGPFEAGTKVDLEAGVPNPYLQTAGTKQRPVTIVHKGWFINVGSPVSCMAWAPTQEDVQYLALAIKCDSQQRSTASEKMANLSPAFAPSPDYPTHIQIWKIHASSAAFSFSAKLDREPPTLHTRLAFHFGNIIQMQWLSTTPPQMALLTTDGDFRIITFDTMPGIFLPQPLLEIVHPPRTIFTAFTFASHQDLVLATADGAVHIYNTLTTTKYLTLQLHDTYISNLIVASDQPHFLVTTTASGDLQLTDLRSPHHDTVRLHRSRLPNPQLSYVPHTRTFLILADAAGNSEPHGTSLSTLMGFDLRHFYRGNSLVKLPEMQGLAIGLAASSIHPYVLLANASGQVFCTNLLRRTLPRYAKGTPGQAHIVKLFEIDWRPITPYVNNMENDLAAQSDKAIPATQPEAGTNKTAESAAQSSPSQARGLAPRESYVHLGPEPIDVFHGRDARAGITRIHHGFQPIPIDFNAFGAAGEDRRVGNKQTRKENNTASAASQQCIFHDEQAVVAMEWNPNLRFATWAAIAWGSGLLWIGDLAHG